MIRLDRKERLYNILRWIRGLNISITNDVNTRSHTGFIGFSRIVLWPVALLVLTAATLIYFHNTYNYIGGRISQTTTLYESVRILNNRIDVQLNTVQDIKNELIFIENKEKISH